ncbi:MAG: translocation/assembly module TamB [Candidatus Omnitrophica bacterium]|nr:translocation/assembly module TamB [Candidatus Omnitrophota bacterium]
MKNSLNLILIIIAAAIILNVAILYAFIGTNFGARLIAKIAISRYIPSKDITIGEIDGTLARTITFENISLNNVEWLPHGSSLDIERLEIHANPLDINRLRIMVKNGKLKLPSSDKIFFSGAYENGLLDTNIYSHAVDVKDIMELLQYRDVAGNLSGVFEDIDIFVTGGLLEPEIKGSCTAKALFRWGFNLNDCPLKLDLNLKDIREDLKLYGTVNIAGGSVSGVKTARITLGESRISFNGSPKEPYFDMQGESFIEGTKIKAGLKGTLDVPDLRLSSDRPVSKDQLLMMLATNKSWKSADSLTSNKDNITPGMVADFMDYFLFGGVGSKTADRFGVKDFFIKYDRETKGGGVKKTVFDKAEVSYSIEQSQKKDELSTTTQKVGSEYKVTDGVTVSAERELKQNIETGQEEQDKAQVNDKIFLKYKKQF